MTNPFRLRWLEGWPFQVVLMEGHVLVVMGLTDDLQNLPRT